jgi:phenylalanyl-tRNA synthetase beta chain
LKDYKIPENAGVVYITFDIDTIIALLKDAGERQYAYETLQDQIVYRDLCFVVDAEKDFEGIVNAVKNVKNVKNIEVFDVYAGANLGEGKKSLAFKMKIMGDADATMTTEQINEVMNAAIAAGENAGGKLRS